MDTVEEQVNNFLNKCDELLQAKFIIAPSKISEILCAIASAPVLVELFEKAAKPFDYLEAQGKYILPSPDGTENKGILVLPDDRMECLAFVFSLLVDIDNQDINFSTFLLTFFADDGSYTEAFESFLAQIILPFKTIVRDELLPKPAPMKQIPKKPSAEQKAVKRTKKAIFGALSPLIKAEIATLKKSSLSQSDCFAGVTILNQLAAAVKAADEKEVKALLVGYNYFVIQTGAENKNTMQIFNLAGEL